MAPTRARVRQHASEAHSRNRSLARRWAPRSLANAASSSFAGTNASPRTLVRQRNTSQTPRKDLPGGFRAFRGCRGWFVGTGAKTDPQDGRLETQPGNAAACFTHVAICASSSSPSWMSM
jgi:hypothetical protein